MDIREAFKSLLLVLAATFYVLLALFLLARALWAIVSDLLGLKGRATAKGLDRGENVVFASGLRRTLGGGRKLRSWMPAGISARVPREPAGAKAQAAISGDGNSLAA